MSRSKQLAVDKTNKKFPTELYSETQPQETEDTMPHLPDGASLKRFESDWGLPFEGKFWA